MTTFALVHGGAHGGWCWEYVVGELSQLGHTAVTPDLPIEDDEADLSDYASTVVQALRGGDGDGDVVVVGHSMAGWTIPIVAAMHPVRRLIFLGAAVPAIGISPVEQHAREPDMMSKELAVTAEQEGEFPISGVEITWERARRLFYHDVDEAIARKAWRRLRRQSLRCLEPLYPISAWPDVPSTYILMCDDRSVSPEWSRRYARDVLGADVIELPGSHSPFYSRPRELVEVLTSL